MAVRLPPDLLAMVDARARSGGHSRAGTVRQLLVEALRATPPDATPPDGIDRAQIRRMLALTPRDRIRHMADVVNAVRPFRGAARRPTG